MGVVEGLMLSGALRAGVLDWVPELMVAGALGDWAPGTGHPYGVVVRQWPQGANGDSE